jgi:hypothetical protein
MGKYVYFDEKEKVIFADYSGLTLTRAIMEEVIAEYRELAPQLPHKVYAVTCYANTKVDPALTDEDYREFAEELAKYRRGVVRYELNDPYTSIGLRSRVVKYKHQGRNAQIYPTREEALVVVRKLEQHESLQR